MRVVVNVCVFVFVSCALNSFVGPFVTHAHTHTGRPPLIGSLLSHVHTYFIFPLSLPLSYTHINTTASVYSSSSLSHRSPTKPGKVRYPYFKQAQTDGQTDTRTKIFARWIN